nr:hypothetical protein [Tanacetum cinerariifolium]
MSADFAVTYTSVHSKARSWSIPSEDPYEEAAQPLLEQAPRSPEYVPDPIELEDHVPAHIPEHPKDLVPAEDEAPIEAYIPEVASAPTPPLPPSFLSPGIRPPHTRAAIAQMRAAVPSTYHSLLPSETPPLLPIHLHVPSTSRRAEIPEADTLPRKRLLLTAPRPGCEVGESSAAAARQPGPTMTRSRRMMTALEMVNMRVSYQVDVRSRESSEFYSRHHEAQKDCAAVRAKIEVLRRERLAYEQEIRDALKSTNSIDSHNSGTGVRRTERATRECTYTDFLMCQPLHFKGTKGVASLSQWFERMESVFHISNYAAENQVKFATCTLHSVALTWWNTHVKTVGHDAAYVAIATELMDQKIRTFAEREMASKRKLENTSRSTQNQQQPNKRQNTDRVYTVSSGEKKQYGGPKPLCTK